MEMSSDNLSSGLSGICNEIMGLIPQLGEHLELPSAVDPADTMNTPYIEVLEQPKAKVRFRYLCEGRSAGAIIGANATNENKSYPTIKIHNYKGDAHVVVSCVTVDEPYRPHPHKLVDKENTCRDGIFFKHFNQENNDEMKFTLSNVGIQCMKKKDIDNSLKKRQEQGVDPFGTGYDHRKNASSINLNAVRLCFQVFLPTADPKEVKRLKPVVSETIYDAKSNADLHIYQLSHTSDTVAGGQKIILLCDKVNKDDIKIRFYEEGPDGNEVWENWGIFSDKDVHKQYAITFQAPRYVSLEIGDPVDVKIQLMNSKGSISDPLNFKYTPLDSGRNIIWRYRKNKAQPLAHLFPDNALANVKVQPLAHLFPDNVGANVKAQQLAHLFPDNISAHVGKEVGSVGKEGACHVGESGKQGDNDYASVEKKQDAPRQDVVHVTFSDENQMEVPDVIRKEKVNDSFEDLLNEVSNLNDNGFIEDAGVMDEFNNNESSVVIEQAKHLGRTEGYGSYSSLQLAMKNQYFIDRNSTGECYEDVLPPEDIPEVPQIVDVQVVPPPRPPSHTKPNLATLQRKSTSDKFPHDEAIPPLPPKRSRRTALDRNLPPVPKYKSFFHKLFFKNKSKSKPTTPRERSLSIDSRKIPGGGSINDDVMLTEAEHYALYTSIAPHATQSEFDEASFYYSPVEGLPSK